MVAIYAPLDLGTVAAGTGGFVVHGQDAGDLSGFSVSSAGDVNGDGFADLIVGAYHGDAAGNAQQDAGDSYVVFGKANGFDAEVDLADIATGTGGFVIHGEDAFDYSGFSVARAGDVNGDGFDDLIIGAPNADAGGEHEGRRRRKLCGVWEGRRIRRRGGPCRRRSGRGRFRHSR